MAEVYVAQSFNPDGTPIGEAEYAGDTAQEAEASCIDLAGLNCDCEDMQVKVEGNRVETWVNGTLQEYELFWPVDNSQLDDQGVLKT